MRLSIERQNRNPTPCTLHRTLSIDRLKPHIGAPYRYTAQTCEYYRPVPLLFVIRRLFLCEGSALAAITTAASSSSLNPTYLPRPSSSYHLAVRCTSSLSRPPPSLSVHLLILRPATKKVARQKTRVALKVYFDPNVAPAQQRNTK